MLPLYEAKMIHLYDTRWATYKEDGSSRPMTEDEKADRLAPMPRYWVSAVDVATKSGTDHPRTSLLGWRRICRATDARTLICTQTPAVGFGDSWFLALPSRGTSTLQAALASFVTDYVARQKLGGTNMNFFTFMQLAMPHPDQWDGLRPASFDRPVANWLGLRVDRLNGWISDSVERSHVRAELDALMFRIYGLDRDEVSYVMDTFPIVKRKDEAAYGGFRTKELILTAYDAMADAAASGTVYRSPWTEEARL